jgi:hypothetical protein
MSLRAIAAVVVHWTLARRSRKPGATRAASQTRERRALLQSLELGIGQLDLRRRQVLLQVLE